MSTLKDPPAQFASSPLHFGHSRPNVTPIEAANALGISHQQVRDLADAGAFAAVEIGDQTTTRQKHLRILRFTIDAWWLEQYLLRHGEEFPWTNTPEIIQWRLKLRQAKQH